VVDSLERPGRPQTAAPIGPGLTRRLAPLYAAIFLQSFALWVPIEKLFMTEIGFTPASVGVMAAVYAIVVPILEVPSGILADRWSRRGVLVLASIAAIIAVVVGGLSQNVTHYMISAGFLGVFFALVSGTVESMVYDTVLEETGDSEAFEKTIGRIRFTESVALVAGALLGGAIAAAAPLRATYFSTAPLLLMSCGVLFLFREPRLHKAETEEPLRRQVAATYRTILARGHIRLVVTLTVIGSVLMQAMLEFGPLWLVALSVPAFLYGPHWAGLTAALGVGGLLGARAWLTGAWGPPLIAGGIVACCVILSLSQEAVLVVPVQVVLTLIVVAVSIPVTRSLHDAVPSAIRAGVASGVGTLTWLTFVPFAILFGFVSDRAGLDRAGWILVGIGVIAAALILLVLPKARPPVEEAVEPEAALVEEPVFPADRFVPPDHPEWAGHWAIPPQEWGASGEDEEALEVARATMMEMPASLRQVIVLRDVQGKTLDDVRVALGLDEDEQQRLLRRARSLVRERLERHVEGSEER
jgi:MFS family permease